MFTNIQNILYYIFMYLDYHITSTKRYFLKGEIIN